MCGRYSGKAEKGRPQSREVVQNGELAVLNVGDELIQERSLVDICSRLTVFLTATVCVLFTALSWPYIHIKCTSCLLVYSIRRINVKESSSKFPRIRILDR